jgi:photosystem II stability/assembly factor-like uncharacterized protein
MKPLIYLLLASFCVVSCETEQIFIPTVRLEEALVVDGTLEQIYFTNASTGIVIGDNGIFMVTTDAGETWEQVPEAPLDVDYNSISFPSSTVGYVSGDGAILKTTDGGIQWELIIEGYHMVSTSFPTEDVGYGVDGNYVFKTTDGGDSWDNIYAYSFSSISEARAVYFYTEDDGYIVDDGWSYVASTADGGNDWNYATERPELAYAHTRRAINGLSYWAAGNDTYYSGMYYSTDGAPIERFSTNGFNTENSRYVYAMQTWDGTHFIAVGLSICAISDDGGSSWTELFNQYGVNFTLDDAAVMETGRYAGIRDSIIYIMTQDCTTCE